MSLVALTRSPSRALEAGERSFVERAPIDFERALAQHAEYCAALTTLGFSVRVLPALESEADATFVEDVALVLPEVAVLTRPGVASRRAEVAAIESALAASRELVLRLEEPCTLEGGDVLVMEDTLYVGQSERTNHAGLKRLAHLLLEHGYRIKAVPVRGSLHLKTACTALDPETLVIHSAWLDPARLSGFEWLEVDPREPFAANVIAVGRDVLCSASHPRTAERIAVRGFDVHTVDISELEKAEAGLTCLSLLFSER